eukprot:GILK01009284.1.p1 GENE.GILK01009284.1~~GILK01009284.1.p1  ORF type:complete len:184 (-),score=37.40 GILK01009284.1:288-839(-)
MPQDSNLHKAAYKGVVAEVEDLINDGEDVNAAGAQGRTPLMRACGGGHTDVVRLLLDKGANVRGTDSSGRNALHWAAISGHVNCGEVLISYDGSLTDSKTNSGSKPLHLAADAGKVDFVSFLLRNGATAGDTDGDGMTAFDLAKKANHGEVCKMLKGAGGGSGGGSGGGGAAAGGGGGCCVVQ